MSRPAGRVIVLDRDGVINEDSGGYIKSPDEWVPIAGSLAAIARLHRAHFRIFVVTNQSGVGRGLYSASTLARIHEKMMALVDEAGGRIEHIYFCPHAPSDGCDCRKPEPGLLRELERDFALSLAGVPLIGDKSSDLELARAVSARPILVRTGYGESTLAQLAGSAQENYRDLGAATDALLSEVDG